MENNNYKIYVLVNTVNGKKYIGYTCNDIDLYMKKRFWEVEFGRGMYRKLHRAIKKYGRNAFTYTILEDGISIEEVQEKEKQYIKENDTFALGYNMTLGGDGIPGYRHTEETKEIIRTTSTGRFHTPETIARISKTHTGMRHTEETRQILIKNHVGMTGKKQSESTKKKIREKNAIYNYVILESSGQTHHTNSLSAFCRERGVSPRHLHSGSTKRFSIVSKVKINKGVTHVSDI